MDDDEQDMPSPGAIADGALETHKEVLKKVGESMLKDAPGRVRFIAKRALGAPGLLLDGVTLATAPNKTRAAFGLAGGALGAAVEDLGGPVGAGLGAAYGDTAGERFYDEHRQAIDQFVDHPMDSLRQGWGDVNSWMKKRTAHLGR